MYDRPATMGANDRLWTGIAEHLNGYPTTLTRDINDLYAHWQRHDLALSQTCSLPYRTVLTGKVQIVATPIYDLPCADGLYFSVIISRDTLPLNGRRAAINGVDSQSGWAALYEYMSAQTVSPCEITVTGSHAASAEAVASGAADFAAIDAVTWGMLDQSGLQVAAETTPTPALPYICALGHDAAEVRGAFASSLVDLAASDRTALALKGITDLPQAAYTQLSVPPDPGSLGIPLLITAK